MKEIPESVKVEIRSVLLSKVGGIRINLFPKEFRDLTHRELNYKQYGFTHLAEFFTSMPDVCQSVTLTILLYHLSSLRLFFRLDVNKNGQPAVFGIVTKDMHQNPTARKAKFKNGMSSFWSTF
jgi:hypothetical protein